jgi:hypothetical protein
MADRPTDYREYAKECLAWAEESTSPDIRQALMALALTWMTAASLLPPDSVKGTAPTPPAMEDRSTTG